MAFKFVLLLAFAAVARGSVVAPVANVAIAAKLADSEFDPNPQYTFAYDVKDAITGDSKSQVETRNGDIVQGQYTVNDPDGTRRVVDYTADPVNGFNAVVSKGPQLVGAAPVVAPVARAVAAPLPVAAPAPVVAARVAAPYAVPAPASVVAARVAAPFAAPAPLAYPAPVAARIAAPVAYSSPVAAAPIAYNAPLPAAPIAYNAPVPGAPLAYSAPFGYSAAYTI
ncbi:structural contituent of cuticle [Holotrichia oblita]|uniref:Structural contituent of cuticle n=1 Tax=Holotrichia oblita TaxID=644536 RepID=A0ACB9SSS1_HOLOL|nr:structural contituent of cuticle [Holotrichia oblita]